MTTQKSHFPTYKMRSDVYLLIVSVAAHSWKFAWTKSRDTQSLS